MNTTETESMRQGAAVLAVAVAGMLASAPMLWAMRRLAQPQETLPPERVTEGLLDKGGEAVTPRQRRALMLAGHFSYGALAAVPFALLLDRRVGRSMARGMAYGLGVWALSYRGWLPLSGLVPRPRRQPWRRRTAVIPHLLWGGLLGGGAAGLARWSRRNGRGG